VEKIQDLLKSDKNNGYFPTWYITAHARCLLDK